MIQAHGAVGPLRTGVTLRPAKAGVVSRANDGRREQCRAGSKKNLPVSDLTGVPRATPGCRPPRGCSRQTGFDSRRARSVFKAAKE